VQYSNIIGVLELDGRTIKFGIILKFIEESEHIVSNLGSLKLINSLKN
jgi:hypothetical protein